MTDGRTDGSDWRDGLDSRDDVEHGGAAAGAAAEEDEPDDGVIDDGVHFGRRRSVIILFVVVGDLGDLGQERKHLFGRRRWRARW